MRVHESEGFVPLDLTAQLRANEAPASRGCSQLTSSHTPANVSIWNRDSVYAMVINTDAGDMHMSSTAMVAVCLS